MTKPKKYQKAGYKLLKKFRGRSLLADEMGLGKSFQALYFAKRHFRMRPVIVVCPASIKQVWKHEASTHFNWNAVVLEGRKPPRNVASLKKASLIIINYDVLPQWKSVLSSIGAKLLIFDECHAIKNAGTQRYKAIKELASDIKYCLALSGTPLTNRPSELWTTLHVLRPDLFKSFWAFAQRYSYARRRHYGWTFNGGRNLPELHSILTENLMVRRRKKDVLKELPDKTRQIVPVRLASYKEYDEIRLKFLAWVKKKKGTSKFKKAKKAQSITQGGYLRRCLAEGKIEQAFNWIDNFLEESDEKLVVFGVHKNVINRLADRYKKISVRIDGSTKVKDRHQLVRKFQTSEKTRLFIGNVQAAGVGLTLTAANSLLFVEYPWSPSEIRQAEDRIHRIGQKKKTTIYFLVAEKTNESSLLSMLQEKQDIIDNTLDGAAVENRFDVYDLLMKSLKRIK